MSGSIRIYWKAPHYKKPAKFEIEFSTEFNHVDSLIKEIGAKQIGVYAINKLVEERKNSVSLTKTSTLTIPRKIILKAFNLYNK